MKYAFATSALVALAAANDDPVDSAALQDMVTRDELAAHSQKLQDIAYATEGRNRVFGSPGHDNTVKYLQESLEALDGYYDIQLQPFSALYASGNASLSIDDEDQNAFLFSFSPSASVEAPFVVVNDVGCNATDYPSEVEGKIALISRGICEFGQKSALAGNAGAAGAVIYNNAAGPVGGGTLGQPPRPEGPYVPTASIAQENGTAIVDAILAGTQVVGQLEINAVTENRTTHNVIAQTKEGDDENVLVIGAHSDSVEAGPGINDNGSGSVGLLTVAKALTKFNVKNAVRFAWWSAEEFGLLGSEHYVQELTPEEDKKIRLYVNFDMIASPNYILGVYDGDGSAFNISGPPGSAQVERFFEGFFKENNMPSVPTAFTGRSDYGPFLDKNIPAGGLFTGAEVNKTAEEAALFGGQAGVSYDENYHLVGDTFDNLNFEAFEINAKAIAAVVANYGNDWQDIPVRSNSSVPETSARRVRNHSHQTSLHSACGQLYQ